MLPVGVVTGSIEAKNPSWIADESLMVSSRAVWVAPWSPNRISLRVGAWTIDLADDHGDVVVTPFGICKIDNLST